MQKESNSLAQFYHFKDDNSIKNMITIFNEVTKTTTDPCTTSKKFFLLLSKCCFQVCSTFDENETIIIPLPLKLVSF
jgi:hypothetical protein